MGTYTGANAVDMVRRYIKMVPLSASNVDVLLVDRIHSLMWCAWPWRWSQASLTAIPLVDGQQDYSLASGDATALLRLLHVRIVRTDVTPDEFRELDVCEHLSPELTCKGGINQIRKIAYIPALSKVRLELAASVPTGSTLNIQGEYQTNPTKITALATALVWPDCYFDVFCDGLLWKCYQFADDPRAGTAQIVKGGNVVYTGQMGVFYGGLARMIETEDYSGTPLIFPQNPLGAQGGGVDMFGPF